MSKCVLCHKDSNLKKSHIIPNSFFKRIKPKGRATEVNPHSSSARRTVQNSWYEELLCNKCEALFCEWERYAIGVIFSPEVFQVRKEISKNLYEKWFGVDYRKFRLFQLSILFRSAVAKGKPWENVMLFEEEIETLRKSLVEESPASPTNFGCLVSVILNPVNKTKLVQTVGSPSYDTVNNRRHFIFVFGGYIWEYVLPSLTYKQKKEGYYLNESGFLKCPSILLWDHPIVGSAFKTAYENELEQTQQQKKVNKS